MDDFLYGFPPPPIFYQKYSLKSPNQENPLESKLQEIKEEGKDSHYLVFNYEKLKCFDGPPPPLPPNESWYSFGTQEKFKEDEFVLDSETLIPLENQTNDLRESFKVLYSEFVSSILTYLDQLKNVTSYSEQLYSDEQRFYIGN
ncbi:conserved hypothetical protein [Theileria orientalis strain Shintoku]|uniref:Mediator of RNA polymerase II transcription subunit 7 n=1 Tax=Theileria orientalis strain Shintoku TaxID=869250 RepID=J4C2W1_THEOR|nr:conserved hypothetical protein [Theileria orientalis strain Shintoku]BAM39381.1 conserved hypothetical protein [Theileria orientalis strain Shintoku]|eukprot:XP_009689682.1 conserved hypothetical protein [Theileria orientalis strain Shintoku]